MFKKVAILFIFIALTFNSFAQQKENKRENGKKEGDNRQESVFYINVPTHDFDIITARPEQNSVTLSVLSFKPAEAYIEYYSQDGKPLKIENFALKKDEPKEILLKNLKSDTRYIYHFYYKPSGSFDFIKSKSCSFNTQRINNYEFTFTITADSHLDQNTDISIYKSSLLNASADSADFHIDLGDTFMTDKYRDNYKDALNQYIAQRYYFNLLECPLFLVQGNHDGESGQKQNGKDNNMTVWSNLTRKKYFPNPFPDGFYTGNEDKEAFAGQPQNYYAWEWGNTLFIVLDPFWYTPRSGSDNPWDRTLGKKQYDWLKKTLEESKSEFKFVFVHNLVGGVDIKGKARGGAEAAGFFEWGGKNADASDGFAQNRPGWELPIHQLFVKYKVSAVFHGHDHLFARQELDGIVYQCVLQPGSKDFGNIRQAKEYGYVNGTILNGPGYLRIKVSKNSAIVDYITTNLKDISKNKETVYSYKILKHLSLKY